MLCRGYDGMSKLFSPILYIYPPFLSIYLLLYFSFKIDIIDIKLIINKLSYIKKTLKCQLSYKRE